MANAPVVKIPRRIGAPPPSLSTTMGLWGLSALLLVAIVQTFVAAQLHFNPTLGPNWHGIYLPLIAIKWYFMVAQPMAYAFNRPVQIYPENVVFWIRLLPFLGIGAVMVSMMFAFITNAVLERQLTPDEEDDLFDSGVKWADEKIAREDGLLDAKCGPVLGAFEVNGRKRLLRYGGEGGGSYTGPPGDWKSLFVAMNSLIPLQHEDAHTWSADERRMHPWGEEPIKLRLDPKFEYHRTLSGGESAPPPVGVNKRVLLLAPNGTPRTLKVDADKIGRYNPAWSLGLGGPTSVQDSLIASDSIISTAAQQSGTAHASHWDRATLGFGAAMWEKLGFYAFNRGQPEMFSLPGLYDFLSAFKSLDDILTFMETEPDDPLGLMAWKLLDPEAGTYVDTRVKPSAVQAARQMRSKDVKERAAVYSTLVAYMVKYSSDTLRRYITRSSFGFRDLANDPKKATVVDLGFEAMDGTFLQPYLRQLVRSMLRDLTRDGTDSIDGRSVRPHLRPWILQVDEANILQYVEEFEMGSGFIRGYGGFLELIWQAEDGQLHKWYTDKTPIKETLGWRLYGTPRLVKTAESIEKELGYRKRPVTIGNMSGDRYAMNPLMHLAESTQLVDLPLLSAKRITQIPKERYIGFVGGHNYYLYKSPVFKIKELRQALKQPYITECEDCYEGRYPYFIQSIREQVSDDGWNAWMRYIRENMQERGIGEDPIFASVAMEAATSPAAPSESAPRDDSDEYDPEAVSAKVREAAAAFEAAKRAKAKPPAEGVA